MLTEELGMAFQPFNASSTDTLSGFSCGHPEPLSHKLLM